MRNAIPAKCFEKDTLKSFSYLVKDVVIVLGLAFAAFTLDQWWAWPIYWFAQGTMFWALFVVGHDCGHQSFSNNKTLNDFVGNIVHSSILGAHPSEFLPQNPLLCSLSLVTRSHPLSLAWLSPDRPPQSLTTAGASRTVRTTPTTATWRMTSRGTP